MHLKLEVSSSGSLVLPVANHVHNRVENFTYDDDIFVSAVGLDYIENDGITPANNLRLNNRTSQIPRNTPQLQEARVAYDSFYGNTYSTYSWDILATNVSVVDEEGQVKPLFWKHVLPQGTVEVTIEEISQGNRNQVDTGYLLDLDSSNIYTNYKNFFDPETGAYRLFYVVSVDDTGSTTHTLLSPVPACTEAGWADVDPVTGNLYTGYPLYTRARGTGENTFTFNTNSQWYVRALGRALIQPRMPMALDANSSWFLRLTNGDFFAPPTPGDPPRQYVIPEYHRQPFSPTAPYIFGSYEELEFVNESILKFPRDNTAVGTGRPLTLLIRDYDGKLLKVLTTDSSLNGSRFGTEEVFYESDKILAVDNAGGFLSLGLKLLPSWQYTATYYYEADDYEYTAVDLNPVYNSSVRNRMVVIYMKPDLTNVVTDTSVYHLVVDDDGIIVDANEPGLQLWSSGSPNPNTVVGTSYGDFLQDYTLGDAGGNDYYVLVEAIIDVAGDVRDVVRYDVRERGFRPVDDTKVQSNPRIVQSYIMDNEDGMIVPRDNVVVIEPPLTLLEDYGGQLSQSEAEAYLTRHLDMSKLAVIRWQHPAVKIQASNEGGGVVSIYGPWDGPGTYTLYRRSSPSDAWVSQSSSTINTLPAQRTVTFSDAPPSLGVYYYCVRVTRDSVEFPEAYSLAIEVVA